MPILTDYHVHSEYSYCATDNTVERVIARNAELGIVEFCFADHSGQFYYPAEDFWTGRYVRDPASFDRQRDWGNRRLEAYFQHVERARTNGMHVGLELDCLPDGSWVLDPIWADRLEFRLGAVHAVPELGRDVSRREVVLEEFVRQTCGLIETGIQVLAHPIRLLRHCKIPTTREAVLPIIRCAVQNGVALEMNGHHHAPDPAFFRLALDEGAKISLGTDSHALHELGDFTAHQRVLDDLGISTPRQLEAVCFRLPCGLDTRKET